MSVVWSRPTPVCVVLPSPPSITTITPIAVGASSGAAVAARSHFRVWISAYRPAAGVLHPEAISVKSHAIWLVLTPAFVVASSEPTVIWREMFRQSPEPAARRFSDENDNDSGSPMSASAWRFCSASLVTFGDSYASR